MNNFFTALKNKRARKEFAKSTVVGWVAVALDFFMQALVLYIAASNMYPDFFSVFTGNTLDGYIEPSSIYMLSVLISFIFSISVNYLLSTFFVFEYGNVGRNSHGIIKFFVFSGIGLAITLLASIICRELFALPIFIVKIVVSIIVFVYNFFTRKHYIFNIALIRDDTNTINL